QMRLAQDLEAVADAQHRQSALGRVDDLAHHGCEAGDGTAPQVVAIGEATREDDGVDALQVVVPVPQRDGLAAGKADGTGRVDVVERAREGDDPDPHRTCTSKSSMTGLDSSVSAIRRTSVSASSVASPESSISKRLP